MTLHFIYISLVLLFINKLLKATIRMESIRLPPGTGIGRLSGGLRKGRLLATATEKFEIVEQNSVYLVPQTINLYFISYFKKLHNTK